MAIYEQDLIELEICNGRTQSALKNANDERKIHVVVQNGVYLTPIEAIYRKYFLSNDLETLSRDGDLEARLKTNADGNLAPV